jgi:hypothetical protein
MLFMLCTVLFRVRRYQYIYYTWETLLNHVFEDLRKTKAPNIILHSMCSTKCRSMLHLDLCSPDCVVVTPVRSRCSFSIQFCIGVGSLLLIVCMVIFLSRSKKIPSVWVWNVQVDMNHLTQLIGNTSVMILVA